LYNTHGATCESKIPELSTRLHLLFRTSFLSSLVINILTFWPDMVTSGVNFCFFFFLSCHYTLLVQKGGEIVLNTHYDNGINMTTVT